MSRWRLALIVVAIVGVAAGVWQSVENGSILTGLVTLGAGAGALGTIIPRAPRPSELLADEVAQEALAERRERERREREDSERIERTRGDLSRDDVARPCADQTSDRRRSAEVEPSRAPCLRLGGKTEHRRGAALLGRGRSSPIPLLARGNREYLGMAGGWHTEHADPPSVRCE